MKIKAAVTLVYKWLFSYLPEVVYTFKNSWVFKLLLLFLHGIFLPNDISEVFLELWFMSSLFLEFSRKQTKNQKSKDCGT